MLPAGSAAGRYRFLSAAVHLSRSAATQADGQAEHRQFPGNRQPVGRNGYVGWQYIVFSDRGTCTTQAWRAIRRGGPLGVR